MDTIASPSSSSSEQPGISRRMPRFALVSIMIALLVTVFLEALDNQVVTVAMPRCGI